MSSLVRRSTGLGGVGYGVNIVSTSPPAQVAGNNARYIGLVADLPWGPVDTPTLVTSFGEFRDQFYPADFGNVDDSSYPALRALLNKAIFSTGGGGVRVVRISPSGQAAATLDFDDSGATESVTVTANYVGALGNLIQIAWSANADTAANRDMTVSISGTDYSVTYENVVVDSGAVVTDPGNPYVTVTKHANYADVPAVVSATSLASGSQGTAAAADYTGTIGSSRTGLDALGGVSVDVDVVFCAEVPDSLVDDVNTGLKSFATTYDKGLVILSTPDAQSSSTALTYVSSNSLSDNRVVYTWPRVETVNGFDSALADVEVDGNAFAAALIANCEPWQSPGGPGSRKRNAELLAGITDLETATASRSTLDNLKAAGVACWVIDRSLGPIIRGGVLADNTSAVPSDIVTQRTRDWLELALAEYAANYVELPLDVNLATQTIGPAMTPLVAAFRAFLQEQQDAGRIKAWSVDPFSQNTESNLDAGRWIIRVVVETFAPAQQIVLMPEIGPTANPSA